MKISVTVFYHIFIERWSRPRYLLLTAAFAAIGFWFWTTITPCADIVSTYFAVFDAHLIQMPHYSQIPDYGYDSSVNLSRMATMASLAICFLMPMNKGTTVKQASLELLGLTFAPVLVHLLGTFIINNFNCYCKE